MTTPAIALAEVVFYNFLFYKEIIFESPIIGEFWRFLTIGLSDSVKRLQTKEKALILLRALKHGAAGGNRTHDPILTKDVRYHYATAARGSPL